MEMMVTMMMVEMVKSLLAVMTAVELKTALLFEGFPQLLHLH